MFQESFNGVSTKISGHFKIISFKGKYFLGKLILWFLTGEPARGVPAGAGPGALLLLDGAQRRQRGGGRQGDQVRALRRRRAQRQTAGMDDKSLEFAIGAINI